MKSVKENFPDHAMALLAEVTEAFRRDVQEALATVRVPPTVRALRGSQIRLLQLTPHEGMRATDLAARVGMTKQALGEFATELERLGLLESVHDPTDRRVRIWRPTARGIEAAEAGDRVVGTVERAWRRRIGAREWDALRATLIRARELAVDADEAREDSA
jgi:DNA-binding MarR family transcriptional regulator